MSLAIRRRNYHYSNVLVQVHKPWVASRWPKTRRMLSGFTFFLMTAITLSGVIVFDNWSTITRAWVRGNATGYTQGQAAGYAAACQALLQQYRWSVNTEVTLVNSGHDSVETANHVIADSQAAYHYVCNKTTALAPNLYDPTSSVPVKTSSPTVPVSPTRTGNPSRLTSRGVQTP